MSSETSSGASFSHLAQAMQDEGEYQAVEGSRGFRVTGLICLLFGLLSGLTFLGKPLVFLPIVSLFFGLIALRKYTGERPTGVRAAKLGLSLAALLGVTGFANLQFQRATLCRQAEKFAMDYLSAMAHGEHEVCMQLHKAPGSRSTAPLKNLYGTGEDAKREQENYFDSGLAKSVEELGPDAQWKLSRPTRMEATYIGVPQFEVVVVDQAGKLTVDCQIFMRFARDPQGNPQWYVYHSQPYRELLVSKGLL
jgi:hypothetical protein